MMDEGYIKYSLEQIDGDAPSHPNLKELDSVRTTLHDLGLIGVYPNGIGFGNLSIRAGADKSFVISGSATGKDRELGFDGYAKVTNFDIKNNSVTSIGKVPASSESMTHGSIYESKKSCNCVIHIHNKKMFDIMLEKNFAHTSSKVAYGTPEMAKAISKLVKKVEGTSGIFVTAGHDEGIIAFGESISTVSLLVISIFQELDGE
jgi:ribulose-5-phosphate 4-epimerase/fuculose-1-phosphate aldolase